jgi:hypothetical protein
MAVLMERRVRALLLAVGLVAAAASSLPAEDASSREYALKAAFLYNFLRFVDRPSEELRPPVVCMVGESADAAAAVERALAGKQLEGHDVAVKALGAAGATEGCALLFVPDAALAAWPQLRERIGCRPVLTVGESQGFLAAGGSIALFEDSNRLRFDVNRAAATCAGLRFSSKLLSLARAVDGRRADR